MAKKPIIHKPDRDLLSRKIDPHLQIVSDTTQSIFGSSIFPLGRRDCEVTQKLSLDLMPQIVVIKENSEQFLLLWDSLFYVWNKGAQVWEFLYFIAHPLTRELGNAAMELP